MPPITTATNANSLTITQAVNKVSLSKFANAPIGSRRPHQDLLPGRWLGTARSA